MYPIRIHPNHKKIVHSIATVILIVSVCSFATGYYFQTHNQDNYAIVSAVVFILSLLDLLTLLWLGSRFSKCPTCHVTLKVDTPVQRKKSRLFTCEKCQTTWDSQFVMYFEHDV